MTDEHPRRRSSDVPPAIELAIEDVASRNRHAMRNEITAVVAPLTGRMASLEARVAESTLRATEEHADVKAKLDRLQESTARVRALEVRVTELEEHEREDRGATAAIEKMNRRFYALAGLIVAAVGVLAGVVHH